MAVLEYTRSPIDSTIKVDMKNVRASVDPSALRVYCLFSARHRKHRAGPCMSIAGLATKTNGSDRLATRICTVSRTAKVLWHSSASAALPRLGTTIHAAILLPCRGRRHFASLLPASQHERKATLHIRPWHLLHQS
jgi:hypothetical protein